MKLCIASTAKRVGISLAVLFCLAAARSSAEMVPFNRIQALEATPVIDGILSPGEWPEESMIRLSRIWHEEHSIRLYFASDANYLYLGAYVEDAQLWADGNGGGSGDFWETWTDDSIEWYFDPDNSRDTYLMDNDRSLALSIGNLWDPENGPGIVSRRSFNKGTGDGGATGTDTRGVMPPGLNFRVHYDGTVNNPNDTDTGYSMEVAVPWSAILMSPNPPDGTILGMNVIVISDDTGGPRDWSDNREIEPPSARFTVPVRPDEYVEMRCGWLSGSQSGLKGPSEYQRLQIHKVSDPIPPDKVGSLSTGNLRPYSITLQWACPGDNGTQGICAGFDVRYSDTAITKKTALNSPVWPAEIYPRQPGSQVGTRVMGLQPNTDYWFAVRARDEAGNTSGWSIVGPARTPSVTAYGIQIPPAIYKGSVRVAPGGRYFMTEDGANFIPVGHHFLFQDHATRYLYPGDVWIGSQYLNWSEQPNARQNMTDYLDELAANGVTVMRIFLESFFSDVKDDGDFNAANGAYWLEFPRGNFNPDMGTFIRDLLELCAERGIYVCLVPFENFFYDEYMHRTCWSYQNGGPLQDINNFYNSSDVMAMCKARWTWVINQVKASGYEDAVFGYEVMNEWDSWEWTRPSPDQDLDARIRASFVAELAHHVRSLDPERLLLSSNAQLDPRGAVASLTYYDDTFDAVLPHLYLPGSREPWNNPEWYQPAAIVREHSRAMAWWTLNQLNRRPVMDGEWGPADPWMPDPNNPSYFSEFTEEDDNRNTRICWFVGLCSGGAGPGLRLQGGVRGYGYELFLSDYMHGVENTLSAFVENGVKDPVFDFTDFPSENWKGHLAVEGTQARILVDGCSDGTKGLVYLLQDMNHTQQTVSGTVLRIDRLKTARARFQAEFWLTAPDQTQPVHVVEGSVSGTSVWFPLPDFYEDLAVRFYIFNHQDGEPESKTIIPVDFNGASVWWDVKDGTTGEWLGVPGSGWADDPQELVIPNFRDKRWYWVGAWDIDAGKWLVGQWVGRLY